ncbi:MAG: PTS sugar transporter subunit IIA [Gammaproteobacteria bacterium]|nr:PTS sugar transporter subunit IIA [Gammaproteobacteria bacterium]MCF6231182.1 PTS sugar transporter subunit IIA [Gammaproteobacteria bacterium]
MSIGLLIITHDAVGRVILETATKIVGICPLATELLPVPMDCDCEQRYGRACDLIRKLDSGSGVVVLTDMYGGTPSNIANRLAKVANVRVVSGVNLPMVVRVLNYASLEIDAVAQKAQEGGREGIFICGDECQ